ncbi:ABC transporter substrate-binding protein [Motilimonas cestriensis]|uniref:ABC transporter substrate-binding protein n=1 Tax=Motilimonas cestriensis TaxID=2742685 RepID=A0ABS8WF17_9GAMM|nr:ABC transporter substrate-binding protein [Motilimonas cestriensis]MCE2597085.1 ABC transporter substrate-binding protein [Motilimonas cestriensis]
MINLQFNLLSISLWIQSVIKRKKIRILTRLSTLLFLTTTLFSASSLAKPQPDVLFINPGQTSESFWHDVDLFMQEAAKQLDLNLITYHAERNPYLMIKKVKQLIDDNQLPDYLVLVNEDNAATKMLYLLRGKPVKVMMLFNGLNEHDKSRFFNHTEGPFLVSSLMPDNYKIGYETAQQLLESKTANTEQAAQILIFSGNKNTPASNQRELGARQFIALHGKTELLQVVYANWDEQIAYKKTKLLLQRYSRLSYVWAANDAMALGAIRAAKESGKTPGKDIFFSAINTSEATLDARAEGTISSLGGSHFMAGGWAMVLISDDIQGKTVPKQIDQPMFQLIEPNTPLFDVLGAKNWQKVNFKQYKQNDTGQYSFSIK